MFPGTDLRSGLDVSYEDEGCGNTGAGCATGSRIWL